MNLENIIIIILIIIILLLPKTIYFNFKYFPVKKAIKLPVFISNKVYMKRIKGEITLNCDIKSGIIRIGFGDTPIFAEFKSRSILNINGKIIFNGRARFGHAPKLSTYGEVEFGRDFVMTVESTIHCFKKIKFGKICLISWENLIMDSDLHKVINIKGDIINYTKEIIIGNNVWIGSRCTI